jgi:hypothetical protein
MAIDLINEVLENPLDLTFQERVLLVILAEQANKETRECWPGWQLIAKRMGWSHHADGGRTAVHRAMANLAKRGVKVRVARGTDANGEPVYAAFSGRRIEYRLPDLTTLPATAEERESLSDPLPRKGSHKLTPKRGSQFAYGKGVSLRTERESNSDSPSLHEPSEEPSRKAQPQEVVRVEQVVDQRDVTSNLLEGLDRYQDHLNGYLADPPRTSRGLTRAPDHSRQTDASP